MEEIWKNVPGYEGIYQVSDEGRVKKLAKGRYGKERILKPTSWDKYKKIAFTKDGDRKYFWVHRLVLEAFNGPIKDGMEIDHIDGNPSNNSLSNLRAVDHKTNMNNPITKERKSLAQAEINKRFQKKLEYLGMSRKDYNNYIQRERNKAKKRKRQR